MNGEAKTIEIRQASPDDLDSIVSVEQSAFPEPRWASKGSLRARLDLYPLGNFVALQTGKIVGFSNGFPIGDRCDQAALDPADFILFEQNGENWLLRNVAVLSEVQGKGVGRLLVERQLEAARDYNAKFFRFTATPNLDGFYSKLGFEKLREPEEFHGVPQAFWEKRIAA